jgi:lipopolysaccharide transport system ATP-binding protein
MTVRLGFSVAAHLEAQIMVIDEVLAVGDADFQRKSLARLNEIRNSGKSIIFVSHSMELVAKLCERVLWLHLGEVKQVGTPSEVIQNYLKYHENQRGQIKRLKSSDGDGSFPFIAELKMLDKNLNLIESVEVGEKVIFKGFVSGLPKDVESVLSFYIWIENQNGLVVAELNSDWKSKKIKGKGLTEFNIVLPRVVLAQGHYTVNSELKVNYQRTDYSLQIFNFFVLASDFYNSGVLPNTRGSFYLDFDIEAVSQKESKE